MIDTRLELRTRKRGRPWGAKDKFPRGTKGGRDLELKLRHVLALLTAGCNLVAPTS